MEYKRFVLKLQCILVVEIGFKTCAVNKVLGPASKLAFYKKKNLVIPNYINSGFPFRSTNRILYSVTVLLRLLTCIVILSSIHSVQYCKEAQIIEIHYI